MKIAIISDIHGNMQALEKVLDDINKENCEKIFCLGDLAMAGPEPKEATALIKEMSEAGDWEVIQGNTDLLIGDFSPEITEKLGSVFPIMSEALKNDVEIISYDNKQFLKTLPKQKELEIEGVNVLLVHGSPRKNDENVLPDMPIEKIEEILECTDADVIFCGHTHIPCGYQTNKKQTVVNVGSVGRPFTQDPKACYAVVNFDRNNFEILHKFIDYDKQKASQILAKRNFKGADKLSQILINPEHRHM